MDDSRIDRPVNVLANSAGRRDAMRALGMAGMALLAALGWNGSAAAKEHARKERGPVQAEKKKGKKKAGPPGPAGADGAPGAPGLPGASGADLVTTRVISNGSGGLRVAPGSIAYSFADCGGPGKVLSCGYFMDANHALNTNVFVYAVGPTQDASKCSASIVRTTEAGSSPGASIKAVAICRS